MKKNKSSITSGFIGKYVIVRSRNEGINAGYVKEADESGIILSESRRLWYHMPADQSACWYEGVAVHGLSPDSKCSISVKQKLIMEPYSITLCSTKAADSISNHPVYGQN